MRRARLLALAAIGLSGAAATRAPAQAAPDTTVFARVDVLPMTGADVLLRDRNVVVAGDRIVAVMPGAAVAPRAGVRVVDGRGRVLLPGLVDAHVHLEGDERGWMRTFLGWGVTTVFNLRGAERHLALRADVAAGRVVGPTVYTAGDYVNLPRIATPADAAREVAAQQAAGYDFVKIHGNLAPATFRTLVDSARARGVAVVGHAPRNLPFDSLLALRQPMVAHAEELLYTHFGRADTAGLGALGPRMRAAGTWLTPNLVAYTMIARQVGRPAVIDSMLALADAPAIPAGLQTFWRSGMYANRPLESAPGYERNRRFLAEVVRGLHDAGVPMLAGTDTPLPGIHPGRSLHEELRLLVDAGLSPYDALATATVNAGRFVDAHVARGARERRAGTVAPGMRADLLLVDADPRAGLATLRAPRGVMAGGRWWDGATLEAMRAGR